MFIAIRDGFSGFGPSHKYASVAMSASVDKAATAIGNMRRLLGAAAAEAGAVREP